MLPRLAIFILFMLGCSTIRADEPKNPHALVGLVRHALADNPKSRKADTYVDISSAELRKSRSFFFPELTARSSYNHDEFRAKAGSDLQRYYAAEVELRQTIFDYSSIVQHRESYQFRGEQRRLGEYQKQLIIYEICNLYLNYLRAGRLIELSKTNNGLSHEHLNSTKQRFKSGELTVNDVNQAETRYLVSNTVMAESINRMELSRLKLLEMAGNVNPDPATLFNLDFTIPKVAEAIKVGKVDKHPNLLSIDNSINKQNLKIQRMKTFNLPKAHLSLSSNRNYDTTVLGYQGPLDETALKIEVSMNLFNGGESLADHLQSKLELRLLQQDKEIFRRRMQRQLDEAKKTLTLKEELVKTYGRACKTAEDAMAGIRKEYLAGTANSIDLMDAQNELFSVQTQQLNARIDLILSKLDILSALGLLDFVIFSEMIIHD